MLVASEASAPVYLDFQELPCTKPACPSVTHHFVGVIAVVLHAVLHQLLLVQVPGTAVRAHECRAIGNVAKENKDELRSPGK